MHYDGGMKLLIDRRVSSVDLGGIPDPMFLHFDEPLVLDFRVKLHKYDNLKSSDAQRRRDLLVFTSNFVSNNSADSQINNLSEVLA